MEADEAFLHILGHGHEDLDGRPYTVDGPHAAGVAWMHRDTQLIQEHQATGILQPFEKEYFRKDGSRVPVLIGVATFEEPRPF